MGTSASWKVVSEQAEFRAVHGGGLRGYVNFDGGPFAFGVWLKDSVDAVKRDVGFRRAVEVLTSVRVVGEGDEEVPGDEELLKKWTVRGRGADCRQSYYWLLRNIQGDLLSYALGECGVWLRVELTGWEDYEYVVDLDKGEVWYRKPWEHREAEEGIREVLEEDWKQCKGWAKLTGD